MFSIENTLEVRYANNFSSLSVSQSLLLRTRTQVKPSRFFFFGSYSTKTGVDARKNVSRINLRLFNSRCDKFMTKLLLA